MLEKNIKSFIDELIKEVEDELDEANVTGNVDGYDTPNAFSGKNSDKKRKKTATQFGYTLVNNDINNIDESVNEATNDKKRFMFDFYTDSNQRNTERETNFLATTLESAIKAAEHICKVTGYAYVEIYYKDLFLGSMKKQNGFKFVEGRGYPKFKSTNESINEASLQKGKTYGGSKCEGGCFIGKGGLKKIIKISKDSPKDVFMFRDDNYSGLQPHFIKDGVIAKATVLNPAYDLEKHKISNLKIGNDVILSVRLFVSTNESVNEAPQKVGNVNAFGASKVLGKGKKVLGFVADTPNAVATLIQDFPQAMEIEFKQGFFSDGKLLKSIKKGDKVWKELEKRYLDKQTKDAMKASFSINESTNEAILNEDTKRVNILGIDFNISEMNGRIFFSFIDKKAASIKIREIGTNKIVNLIQNSLDKAYGKGEFFFKGGDHAEFQNGYLFQRSIGNIKLNKLKFEALDPKAEKFLDAIQVNDRSIKDLKNITVDATPQGNWSVYYKGKRMFTLNGKMLDDKTIMKYGLEHMDESISEGKSKRPVNRWLELKNDESMHANKKLATGLRELKYQLKEVETFFRWYNQIKTMNELSSDTFWKRTHGHIYKIKERLINIAKTIQEIEK